MKFANIIRKLYAEPWLVTPAMHKTMCEILRAHIGGGRNVDLATVVSVAEPEWDKDEKDTPQQALPANIAYVPVVGVIGQRLSSMEQMCGGVDVLALRQTMDAALINPGITGVLLHLSTPGGAVTGIPEMAEYIENYGKPIVAFTDDICASAGYWLASQCSAIVASLSAQVGCIGVYQAFLDESRAYEMDGYKTELFKTGKYKGMGTPGLPLTDEQRALIQGGVDQVFVWFKHAVTDARPKVSDEEMQGQTFYAEDAIKRGLVDDLGDMAAAVQLLQEIIQRGQSN